jgi:tetratricopeptide (TPR) repeat protein
VIVLTGGLTPRRSPELPMPFRPPPGRIIWMNSSLFLLNTGKDDVMRQIGIGFLVKVASSLAGILLLTGGLHGYPDENKPDAKKADNPNAAFEKELLEFNRPPADAKERDRRVAFIKDKERAKKGIALALEMQKKAKGADKPFNFTGLMTLGQIAEFLKENAAAAAFFEQSTEMAAKLGSGAKMLQAYQSLIDLYWDMKNYQKVAEVCQRFVDRKVPAEIENAKGLMLERFVQAKAKHGDIDDALRVVDEMLVQSGGSWYFTQLRGWVQREGGKFDDAIDSYLEVIKKLDADKDLEADLRNLMKDRVRYTLSGVYTDKKDIDNAGKQLQTLIERNPTVPTYKNDLGYIWADHDRKLDEAEKLIREALDLDRKQKEILKKAGRLTEVKESAAYLDSMGWVLFKKKKYAEALVYMKKAATEEGEGAHLEIWSHLGDVYMANGQKKEATDAWQKALTMDDVSKRDVERRKNAITKLKAAGVEPKVKEKTPPRKSERF